MRIESGVFHIEGNTWKYEYGNSEGTHIIVFTAEPGVKPQIGGSIEAGVYIPLTEYIIVDDKSRWEKRGGEDYTYYEND